ncbi:MAG TPA: hypothetical protein VK607_24765 [Kofleriaceae bacterium]|nr:hypothetical protein [Kofleriaceae bacterium]
MTSRAPPRRWTVALAALAAAVVVAAAPVARADQAPALEQQGRKAARDHDWESARERFEQAYALDPRPVTLFELAVAQEHTERLVEARESYALFLEQPATRANELFRQQAKHAIPALDAAIPTLRVRATGLAASDAVEIDGRAVTAAEPVALDPGAHTLVVRRGREAIAQRTITLARGARDEVELAAPAPPPPVVPPPVVPVPAPPTPALTFERAPPAPERTSILRSGWFWGATAAVVVATGAGIYYFSSSRDPTRGTLGPGVITVP